MKVRILASACRDLLDGYKFYEQQSPRISDYFLDAIYSDIDALVLTAGIHPKYFGNYHRLLSKRFPFAIYYRVEKRTALVYAILDCRRSPAWARERMA
ncbi:MAG: type II toxin-antitoxin system RelE/ParE family toxin [Gammaproteobacteria bacterium]|nr:type II toxin-antitoxin system RelE/ParE family toxin [Gammaproteobacteria bacterium]